MTTTTTPPRPARDLTLGGYPVRLPTLRDSRLHLAAVISTVQVLGQVALEFNVSIAQILISIGTCALLEVAITFARRRELAWPASAMLTGNGIALILRVPGTEPGDWWSTRGWWVFAGTAAIGLLSKYVIRTDGRPVFNPSNVALVITFVVLGEARADPQYLWWGPLGIGLVLVYAVIGAGSVGVTRRVGQLHSALSFWATWAVVVGLVALSGHGITATWHLGPIDGWSYWWLLVASPEVLIFMLFMITDPRTAPRGRVAQSMFGVGVAVVAGLLVAPQSGEFGTKVGLLAGLVLMCPFVTLISRVAPAASSARDSLRAVAAGRVAGTAAPRWRALLSGGLGVLVLAGSLVVVGGRTQPAADHAGGDLALRASVPFDPTSLPPIELDDEIRTASITITEEDAAVIGREAARSLVIEAAALQARDPDLAGAALTGVRLAQALDVLERTPPSDPIHTHEYDWRRLTVTLVRVGGGPQTPPELALRGEGIVRTVSQPKGVVVDEARTEMTFVLHGEGGTYLVENALDADGRLVGDQRAGGRQPIPDAVTPRTRRATPDELAGLRFRDVTAELGLDAPHSATELRDGPAVQTGGAAVGDFDDDGDDDIYVTRIGLPNLLYRNDGGRFVEVGEELGVSGGAEQASTGALWVDVDGDGALDLLVLGFGSTPHRLLLQRDGRFEPATDGWALPVLPPPDEYATTYSATAGDYDRDGRVDLLIVDGDPARVTNALNLAEVPGGRPCSDEAREVLDRQEPAPSRTRLLRNTGDGFEDRTERLGTDPSLVVAFAPRFVDLDDDGWDDLVITGDYCTSRVLMNDRRGGFEDVTRTSGAGTDENGMGSEIFDADGDGNLDWFVTGISYPTEDGDCPVEDVAVGCSGNRLYLGNGDGTFRDGTDQFGLRDGYWGWGAVAGDFNLDGNVGLMMTNGYRTVVTDRPDDGSFPDRPVYERSVDDPDLLWLGVGEGPWPEVAEDVGLVGVGNGKAVVRIDYDGDGRLDLFVVETERGPRLFRNEADNDFNWVSFRLRDPDSSNRFAVGATVRVDLGDGGPLRPYRVGVAGSFQSGVSTDVHVGLGDVDVVPRVEIRWPDGARDVLTDVDANRVVEVTRTR